MSKRPRARGRSGEWFIGSIALWYVHRVKTDAFVHVVVVFSTFETKNYI